MTTWTLEGPAFDASTEVLRSVRIITGVDRPPSSTSYFVVTARMVDGDYYTDLGSWDQSSYNLAKGVRRELLLSQHTDKRIPSGRVLRVHVNKVGLPADILGTSVEFVFEKAGGSARAEQPLIGAGDGGDTLTTRINRARFGLRTAVVQLSEPVSAIALPAAGYQLDNDASDQSTSSTSYVDSNVAVTVPVVSGRVTRVMVNAGCTFAESATNPVGYIVINDGSSDYGERRQLSDGGTGDYRTMSTFWAGEITAETTFTMKVKVSAGTGVFSDQSIAALYVDGAS